jgi:hypothetical protein
MPSLSSSSCGSSSFSAAADSLLAAGFAAPDSADGCEHKTETNQKSMTMAALNINTLWFCLCLFTPSYGILKAEDCVGRRPSAANRRRWNINFALIDECFHAIKLNAKLHFGVQISNAEEGT